MKILYYGHSKEIRRVKSCLEFSGAETLMVYSGIDNVISLGEGEGLSMAIVDVPAVDSRLVYDHIKKLWDIPVILLLGDNADDWNGMDELDADGYLHRNAGEIEIVARVEAVRRRVQKATAQTKRGK